MALTALIEKIALRLKVVARPSADRWHKKPTPILGGVAIYVSFCLSLFFVSGFREALAMKVALIGGGLIFGLGLYDDLKRMRPYTKLSGEIIAAAMAIFLGVYFKQIPLAALAAGASIFWIVAITNAFNLMDNMDGLAAGVAFIASLFLFLYSITNGIYLAATLAAIMAGATLGFLRYNFNPARIFMGDCGSLFLGYMISITAVLGTPKQVSSLAIMLIVPVLVLGVPIFDTALVTLIRTFKGLPASQGGKDHTSHRLVVLGMTEKKAVLFLYSVSAVFGGIAVLYPKIDIGIILILAALTLVSLFVFGMFLGEVNVYGDGGGPKLATLDAKGNRPVIINTFYLHKRRMLEVLIDLVIVCTSYYGAWLIRFEGSISPWNSKLILESLPIVVALKYASFIYFELYKGVWRYIGITDLVLIFKANSLASIMAVVTITFLFRFTSYPRAVFLIDWLISIILISGARVLIRVMKETFDSLPRRGRKVLIMGAGDAGEMILREMRNNKKLNYEPVGFLDDDPAKHGSKIHGMPVLGTRTSIPRLIKEIKVDEIIIAIPSATEEQLKGIYAICEENGLRYKRMLNFLS